MTVKARVSVAMRPEVKEAAQRLFRTGRSTCISREFSRFLSELVETREFPFMISRVPGLRGAGAPDAGSANTAWPIEVDESRPWDHTTLSVDAALRDEAAKILADMGLTMTAAANMFVMQCLFESRTYPTGKLRRGPRPKA